MATSVCVHNQNGFCKYKDNCRYLHVNELCSNSNCSSKGCKFRHPRPCRYFNAFGACKFGHNCSYQHLTPIRDEIQLIKQEIFSLKTQLDNLAKCLENGLATLQNKEPPVTLQFPNNPHVQSNTNEIDMTSEDHVDIPQVDGASELATGSGYSPFECGTCQQKFADPDDFVIHDSYQFKCHDCHSCFPVRIALDLHRCNTHRRRR